MVDPRWTRGTLSRPQMELVATRVAQLRDCFY
jgi:alkylhydroperoxidase family enzyme